MPWLWMVRNVTSAGWKETWRTDLEVHFDEDNRGGVSNYFRRRELAAVEIRLGRRHGRAAEARLRLQAAVQGGIISPANNPGWFYVLPLEGNATKCLRPSGSYLRAWLRASRALDAGPS